MRIVGGYVGVLLGVLVSVPSNSVGAAEQTTPVEAPAAANEARFYVGEFQVMGNTLLSPIQIELALTPYLGEDRTVKDIETARQALELRYRDAGYATALVNIPEQDVVDGIVQLQVVEGKVERLRITGARYFSLERMRVQVPALAKGTLPYLPDVQSQLVQLNARTGDRAVTPVLRPGRTPGTMEVELRVKDALPLHADIELNNRYGANTSKLRLAGGVRYDNLWQREHSLSLQYQTAPEEPDEVKVASGTYLWRFTGSDKMLVLYGVKSDSETAAVGTLNVVGRGRIAGVRGIVPLAARPDYSHSLSFGFDYKNFDETIQLQGADTLKTPIDYVNWAVQYNGTAREGTTITRFTGGPNFGMRGVANKPREFDDKRFKAKPNYLYVRGQIEQSRPLGWSTSLALKLEGQITVSPLISNEQFSAGGVQSVRGYLESSALGDDGVAGSLEWRTPSFAQHMSDKVKELTVLVFVDAARLRVRDPLPSQQADYELYGAGVGLRFGAWDAFTAELDWAFPLRDEAAVTSGDEQVHFNLRYSF